MKRAWVLTGDGINCEEETAEACARAGFHTDIFHLSELLKNPRDLSECSLLVIPGGFSFGDELGSGRVLSLRIRHQLRWNLADFAEKGGLVLGICNGFQVLVALGVFGDGVALAANSEGRFRNEWVKLRVSSAGAKSPFLEGIKDIELPIRHGEGRLMLSSEREKDLTPALEYESNPNGSWKATAGLLDSTGRIFGLMPHPEAFLRQSHHPGYFRKGGDPQAPGAGFKIFQNAFNAARSL